MAGLEIGQIAPDFTLPGVRFADGVMRREEFSLSAERGHPVVLAFYPLDSGRVCTDQLGSYQDKLAGFDELGARLWGISPQSLDSHANFARTQGLTFPLLSDTAGVAHAYGTMLGELRPRRSLFIIDAHGRIAWKHVALMLGLTYRSAEQLRERLRRLSA